MVKKIDVDATLEIRQWQQIQVAISEKVSSSMNEKTTSDISITNVFICFGQQIQTASYKSKGRTEWYRKSKERPNQ